MDASGEVADVLTREGLQVTEAAIKLMAAGAKNLTAFLWALAKDGKKLSGRTNMGRLLREGKELKVFRIRESDLPEFQAFAKKNVLYAAVKDKKTADGTIDLITNVDYVSPINLFMERRGYGTPTQEAAPKKADPRAPQGRSSPQRGSGSTASPTRRTRTRTTDEPNINDIPTVKGRLAALRAASEGMRSPKAPQRDAKAPPKAR